MTDTLETVDQETGEVTETPEGREVTIPEKTGTRVLIGGEAYRIVKLVNVPTLKHESGETVCIRIDDKIRRTTNTQDGKEVELSVVRVTLLSSMQPFEYVCNAMTADNLHAAYPEDSYVGKCFAIQKRGVVAGKRYKETHVVEIEPTL